MFVWFGKKTKVEAVAGGRVHKGSCPRCGAQARFRECVVTSTWTAYSVVDLTDSKKQVFRCSECAELFELEERVDPVAEAKLRELRARKAQIEMALRNKQRAEESAKRERQVNSELAALKRKMGI